MHHIFRHKLIVPLKSLSSQRKEKFGHTMSYKVSDCVHNDLSLPSYVQEIVTSKEFQRLRNLKQLGVTNFVYKAATHNRAEHCIGTAFLCSRLLETIEQNSSQEIDELHKKCVVIAGLLHDLGHGPFSHLWEGVVHQGTDKTWTHEQQSLNMVEHMIGSNNIRLHESSDLNGIALRLITSLITGDCATWKELLKPEEMFITEIVSNKFCHIDVDKCDYILRDEFHVKEFVSLKPFSDFLQRARIVFDESGTSHIGYHCDDFKFIENLFYNRAYLHMNIYQHHRVAGAERMVKDICVQSAAGGVTVANLPLTEVHMNSDAYLKLDDTVLDLIKSSGIDDHRVREAKKILKNLSDGRHYSMIWESCDDNGKTVFDALVNKFGPIFCIIEKVIPSAEVPSNIPLYNDSGDVVSMRSELKLSYMSSMIYCLNPDDIIDKNVKNFIDSLNNNI